MFVVCGVRGGGVDTAELVGAAFVHMIGAAFALPLALVGFAIGSRPAETPAANDAASS